MATAIYMGLAMHGLAVMLAGGVRNGSLTPGNTLWFTLIFDVQCMIAMFKYVVT